MKNFKFVSALLIAFVLGICLNNFAMSTIPTNIAVVDVSKVVSNSAQVKALKQEQETKLKNLQIFVENARKDVAAQTDKSKKKALEDKYNKELNTKKSNIEKEYAKKLQAIDKNISSVIATVARQNNYSMVLAKSVVLYGGNDITSIVQQSVK